ncbi:hypothetical protein PVAG01_07142 [Phlyctema vagabunda]|uniref:ATP-citrate synthase/succinyl-CoA ligase C-terminal domain-containing protein n=1 Tax=Phlyctema vagabunda TaxID=108571 RepID=A0ABR4PC08_9HELO
MGGDVIAGTNFVDVLEVFEKDDDTEGIVLIGEIGGTAEMDAAAWIKSYHERTSNPKPISALVGGVNAVPGRVFGHAGAFISPGEPDALTKSKALSDVGVTIVDHPSRFGSTMKTLLEKSVKGGNTIQKRGLHSLNRTSRPRATSPKVLRFQKRSLYIRGDLALNMLRQSGVNASEYSGQGKQRLLAISVDRTNRCPCVVASPTVDPDQIYTRSKKFPFDYREGLKEDDIKAISLHLELEQSSRDSLPKLTQALLDIFMKKEAFLVETKFVERLGELKVTDARFGFDDAAYRSAKRQADVHALRRVEDEDPTEVEAEKDGIVYIKLHGSGTIGTLVNGAGLAMNVVDKLGGRSTNFLDTGGKATSETIKRSFQAVLQDQRAKVVFVNIFGGLTMGDMIARGILLAFRDLDMSLPVVVRIRGTNEAEGQRIIAESGLPLYAYQDFDEAAAKAVELADG